MGHRGCFGVHVPDSLFLDSHILYYPYQPLETSSGSVWRGVVGSQGESGRIQQAEDSFSGQYEPRDTHSVECYCGISSVLVSDDSSPAEKAQYCDIIQKNSDLLLHLINDILDISRMESGKIKFVWEECDVVELCQTALSTAEYGRKTSALFLFETPVASLVIKTDAQRLKQVLINLLSNAAKFTPSGSIKLAIAIDKQHQQLELSVSDTGCGIPSDKSDRVFERFEKLNEYSQGTGLGLAISRLIVENLGGKIWVDKDYTEGARFVFTHPLTKKEKE